MWGFWYRKRKKAKRPANGIKAQTGRGGRFGASWWGQSWLAALEALIDPARLGRGRSYARSGQVLDLEIATGLVRARVQGSRQTPYKVTIRLAPLDDRAWARVTAAMAARAVFAARLLNGEMPAEAKDVFEAAGVSLFPQHVRDLETDCTCPDWANPCKHVAAVYYLLTERFDADPFFLFLLRGRKREALLGELRAQRAGARSHRPRPTAPAPTAEKGPAGPAADPFAPLSADLASYWALRAEPGSLPALVTPAPLPDALIRLLDEPDFWPGPGSLRAHLGEAYREIAAAARVLAEE